MKTLGTNVSSRGLTSTTTPRVETWKSSCRTRDGSSERDGNVGVSSLGQSCEV